MAGAGMAINGCTAWLKKQRAIDRLTEELHRLKPKLRHQERQMTAGFFGSATPSAKRPVKANPSPAQATKRKGARPGHLGAGRQAFDASQAERDLRPTVIARKIGFGSQSDAGAQTWGVLMSVLHTLKNRQVEVVAPLKAVLDQLALNLHQDPYLPALPRSSHLRLKGYP
jgi:Transposase IS66 family